MRTKLGQGGRFVVPAEAREALGMKEGDDLVVVVRDGYLEVMTPERAVSRAQEAVRRHVPEGVSLVDELTRERREAAASERASGAIER